MKKRKFLFRQKVSNSFLPFPYETFIALVSVSVAPKVKLNVQIFEGDQNGIELRNRTDQRQRNLLDKTLRMECPSAPISATTFKIAGYDVRFPKVRIFYWLKEKMVLIEDFDFSFYTCCVTFDFDWQSKRPFPPQFAVMNKMLRALQVGANALLESPTGTGKVIFWVRYTQYSTSTSAC